MVATMIPAETALELATINGAKALLWDDEIGLRKATDHPPDSSQFVLTMRSLSLARVQRYAGQRRSGQAKPERWQDTDCCKADGHW